MEATNYQTHPDYVSFEVEQERALEHGYARGAIAPIDADIATEFPCEICGSEEMYGTGFYKSAREGNSSVYRAFSVCRNCGHCEEF